MPDTPEDPHAGGGGKAPPSKASRILSGGLIAVLVVILGVMGYGLYDSGGRFLLQLQDTNVSRGLITFLVAIATVSIALILSVWVIASGEEAETVKARFSLAKDVLATLVGILGTVLGFYFGSSDKTGAEQLALADIQFQSGQVITHISGGTPPYRYSLSFSEGKPTTTVHISKDGWIFEVLPSPATPGMQVSIEVTDSRDRKLSKSVKYQPGEHENPAETTAASAAPAAKAASKP